MGHHRIRLAILLCIASLSSAETHHGQHDGNVFFSPSVKVQGQSDREGFPRTDGIGGAHPIEFTSSALHFSPVSSLDLVPRLHRILQDSSSNQNVTTPSPDAVCSALNQALKNQMTCACSRFDKNEVEVSCYDLNELCNSDQSWCALSNINFVLDRSAQSRVMLSCTNVTNLQPSDAPLNTCVQLFPSTNGNFSNISQCNVRLNDQICTCRTTCPSDSLLNATTAGNNDTATYISIDCCDVQDGALASCVPVSKNGRVLVLYDALPNGQCPANHSSASTPPRLWFVAVMPVLVAFFVSWTGIF